MFLCESPVTAGTAQDHYDPVLLDLCYLQELDVILCVWKLLQLSVSPPQIIDLLLQSLQSSFSSTHRLSSEWLLSMERMSSVKILSLSSTAVCAERC